MPQSYKKQHIKPKIITNCEHIMSFVSQGSIQSPLLLLRWIIYYHSFCISYKSQRGNKKRLTALCDESFKLSIKECPLLGFAVAAKHLDDFVLVELGHLVASGTAILAWVKLTRFLSEYLAHCSGEG